MKNAYDSFKLISDKLNQLDDYRLSNGVDLRTRLEEYNIEIKELKERILKLEKPKTKKKKVKK